MTVRGMDNNIKNQRLKNMIGQNAGEGQEFVRFGGDNAENEVGVLKHDSQVGERPARRPPFVLKEQMQLFDLRFRKLPTKHDFTGFHDWVR